MDITYDEDDTQHYFVGGREIGNRTETIRYLRQMTHLAQSVTQLADMLWHMHHASSRSGVYVEQTMNSMPCLVERPDGTWNIE